MNEGMLDMPRKSGEEREMLLGMKVRETGDKRAGSSPSRMSCSNSRRRTTGNNRRPELLVISMNDGI